jgi:hypothetical protein
VSASEIDLRRLTHPGRHACFGYYNLPVFSPDGTRHLALLAPFRDRLPAAADCAQPAETTAGIFQQSAMLQWLGASTETVGARI